MDDSRIPVLVGSAQFTQREPDPLRALSPLDLTAKVAMLAAEDSGAGARLIDALDSIVVIRSFSDTSWRFECPFGRYTNPPRSLAGRIGAHNTRRLVYTHPGGNMPQWSLNRLCEIHLEACRCAKRQAVLRGALDGPDDVRVRVTEEGRSPGADEVDVLASVSAEDARPRCALDEHRGTSDGAKGADRAVHASRKKA